MQNLLRPSNSTGITEEPNSDQWSGKGKQMSPNVKEKNGGIQRNALSERTKLLITRTHCRWREFTKPLVNWNTVHPLGNSGAEKRFTLDRSLNLANMQSWMAYSASSCA